MRIAIVLLCAAMRTLAATASEFQCVQVPRNVSLCHGLLHSEMKLPNLAGDKTLSELITTSESWRPLVSNGNLCHPLAQLFLCSVITPICMKTSGASQPLEVPPCRSFCEAVRSGCSRFLRSAGSQWPIAFRCSRFPSAGICYSPNITQLSTFTLPPANEKKKCEMCGVQVSNETLQEYYCVSSMVLVGQVTKRGMVVPRGKNLSSKSVLYGMTLAQQTVTRTGDGKIFFNVSGACTCASQKRNNIQKPKRDDDSGERGPYLIFVDNAYGHLAANLVVSLDSLDLTKEQATNIEKVLRPTQCGSRANSGTESGKSGARKERNSGNRDSNSGGNSRNMRIPANKQRTATVAANRGRKVLTGTTRSQRRSGSKRDSA